ncbi:TPA: hypothetical protein SF279_001919, partial [Campylobacter coli]|nr:hypothetical protein [Campylobacter coli]HED1160710.1 hypothetical protein [Campylobacter coli]HEG8452727.1 hypothetical protein [Campylobacter coli]HEG8506987.1 hypothetical protein [Campylobacter coli]
TKDGWDFSLDSFKANEYSNIVFYCENDEEHFIFTEVKLGNYFCINR